MNKKILICLAMFALLFSLAFSAGAVCSRAFAADVIAPPDLFEPSGVPESDESGFAGQWAEAATDAYEGDDMSEDATILIYGIEDVPGYTLPDVGVESEQRSVVKPVLVCVVLGLVIALIVSLSVKSGYKPVQRKRDAAQYLVDGSLRVTASEETFLRSERSERTIEQKNNS